MKKLFVLLILLTKFSTTIFSQDSLLFKSKYLPGRTYYQTIEQSTNAKMNIFGSDEFLENLKNKGIDNPTITSNESLLECVIKTGIPTDKSIMTLTMEFVKIISSDGKQAMPEGTILYGNFLGDNMPTIDSISMSGIDDKVKNDVLQSMQSIYSQLNFPEKKLKVGDEFIREAPLSIPISDITLEMLITTKYKLKSVSDGIASFDISQIYTMETTITKYAVKADGNGEGQLLYDVDNHFDIKYQMDTHLELSAKLESYDVNVNSESSLIQTTTITKN